jgi:hypothetical protein
MGLLQPLLDLVGDSLVDVKIPQALRRSDLRTPYLVCWGKRRKCAKGRRRGRKGGKEEDSQKKEKFYEDSIFPRKDRIKKYAVDIRINLDQKKTLVGQFNCRGTIKSSSSFTSLFSL